MTTPNNPAPGPRTIRFLSAADVHETLPMTEAVEAMKEAFVQLACGQVVMPLRSHLRAVEGQGDALVMPSYLPGEGRMGVKVVTIFKGNESRGLPRIQAMVILIDGTCGRPLAIIDGASLTAIRTGAAAGAATEALARQDAAVCAIFGAGVQGRTQLEAVCAVRSLRTVRVVDPSREAAESFRREMQSRLGVEVVVAENPSEAVRDADVICTATTSRTPVFRDIDLESGVHINAVGSYTPDVCEIPEETVVRARVIVDHRESALSETGDLIQPLQKGLIRESHIRAELGEVLSASIPGRTSGEEITLFKSVGVAVQDLAAATRAVARAEAMGLGTEVPV